MTTIKVLKQAKESIVRDINTLLPQLRENVSEHITSLSELLSKALSTICSIDNDIFDKS